MFIYLDLFYLLWLGMAFNISLGFSGLTNDDAKEDIDKVYALFVGDTVIVNEVLFAINNTNTICFKLPVCFHPPYTRLALSFTFLIQLPWHCKCFDFSRMNLQQC